MATGTKLKTPEELTIPELDETQILRFLKKLGYCLDNEWRIRKFMREPFIKLKADHIAPMIEIHLVMCNQAKKDPEAVPIHLGYFEEKLGLFFGNSVGMIPEQAGGEICVYQDRMNHQQVVLKHRDYYAYAKNQRDDAPVCTLFLIKFMERTSPTGAESIEELLGPNRFLTPEGMIVGQGGSIMTLSIDDILGPPPEPPKEAS